MKKSTKILSSILCVASIAGCSCNKEDETIKANISNGDKEVLKGVSSDVKGNTLQNIYDDLKSTYANERTAEKLVEIIGDSLLTDATWKARYDAKVEEKLAELAEDSTYFVDGKFDEEVLVKALSGEMYNITCPTTDPTYGPTTEENMICNYDDYVNKVIKVEALTEIIKEKYIYDKVFVDKENILTSKNARLVEYISISSEDEDAFDFIKEQAAELVKTNPTITLEGIADAWEQEKIDAIMEEYNKIGTKDDASGSTMNTYTDGYTRYKEEVLAEKKQEVYDEEYYNKVVITNDSKDILNTTLVERLLSDNVLTETALKTIKVNDEYYLVSPLAGQNVTTSDIRITDTTNSKYYIVKVQVINKDSDADLIYDAVKVMATNTTLVSDAFNYYLEQNKDNISVHDEEVYEYLKTLYPDIFED